MGANHIWRPYIHDLSFLEVCPHLPRPAAAAPNMQGMAGEVLRAFHLQIIHFFTSGGVSVTVAPLGRACTKLHQDVASRAGRRSIDG